MKSVYYIIILCDLLLPFASRSDTTRYATLWSTNGLDVPSCAVSTNDLVELFATDGNEAITGYSSHGTVDLVASTACCGLTNVTVVAIRGGLQQATIRITSPTPPPQTVVSNYIPADAIVIPASATGNVQVILESSPDLVNWTAASPGIYGASAGTNRFFRVRAVVLP